MYIFPKPTVKGIVDNVDILEWGFKIVDGRPCIDDESIRMIDAVMVFWDTERKVIVMDRR
jgi:hypothetical protein